MNGSATSPLLERPLHRYVELGSVGLERLEALLHFAVVFDQPFNFVELIKADQPFDHKATLKFPLKLMTG